MDITILRARFTRDQSVVTADYPTWVIDGAVTLEGEVFDFHAERDFDPVAWDVTLSRHGVASDIDTEPLADWLDTYLPHLPEVH